QRVGWPAEPRRRRTVVRQRDQLATILRAEKTAPNHALQRNPSSHQRQAISPETSLSRGIAGSSGRRMGGAPPKLAAAKAAGRSGADGAAVLAMPAAGSGEGGCNTTV